MKKVASVDEYIDSAPRDVAVKLRVIRKIIKDSAPEAEEKISYGMPSYGYKGRLAYFAYAKQPIGLYLTPPLVAHFKAELDGYSNSNATVRFPHSQKLPVTLIKKLITARMKMNEANKSR